jgi:quercetin dioxygenase-like cupin family protein
VTAVNVADAEPRFGDWGPGYLIQEDDAMFGAVLLRPGDEFDNHLHEHHTETFYVIEGAAELWLDRHERIELASGDLIGCRPGVEHYLRNVGTAPFRALFIKTPGIAGDKVDAPWHPEERNPA